MLHLDGKKFVGFNVTIILIMYDNCCKKSTITVTTDNIIISFVTRNNKQIYTFSRLWCTGIANSQP